MGESVEDVRPDDFLREIREHGDVGKACKKVGWSVAEFKAYCNAHPQYDLTQVEIYLEYIEENIATSAQKRLDRIRVTEMMALSVRHG